MDWAEHLRRLAVLHCGDPGFAVGVLIGLAFAFGVPVSSLFGGGIIGSDDEGEA